MDYDVKSTGKAEYCGTIALSLWTLLKANSDIDSDQPDDGFDHRASNPQSCDKINCLEKEWAKLLQIDPSWLNMPNVVHQGYLQEETRSNTYHSHIYICFAFYLSLLVDPSGSHTMNDDEGKDPYADKSP